MSSTVRRDEFVHSRKVVTMPTQCQTEVSASHNAAGQQIIYSRINVSQYFVALFDNVQSCNLSLELYNPQSTRVPTKRQTSIRWASFDYERSSLFSNLASHRLPAWRCTRKTLRSSTGRSLLAQIGISADLAPYKATQLVVGVT